MGEDEDRFRRLEYAVSTCIMFAANMEIKEMNNIKEELISSAKIKGICQLGLETMNGLDVSGLIDYYIENPDWCLERNFPSLECLRNNFSSLGDLGIYVGKTFSGELLNEHQVYIFHNCKGNIRVGLNEKKRLIPMLYLANACRLRIIGTGRIASRELTTVVPVYSFGPNDISARNNKYVTFNHIKRNLV